MKIAITAIAAIAGAATASPYFTASNGFEATSQAPAGATATVAIDISGIDSWDANGDIDNTWLFTGLVANAHVVGIGWDVNQATVGASWLSEMQMSFGGNTTAEIFLTPSGTGAPGSESNSSGGIFDLVGSALDFFVDADGILAMEFFEGFDDVDGAVDGNWLQGSVITIEYVVPAPGALAMLGLGGLVAGRRRR